jgi:hypothetical protein
MEPGPMETKWVPCPACWHGYIDIPTADGDTRAIQCARCHGAGREEVTIPAHNKGAAS